MIEQLCSIGIFRLGKTTTVVRRKSKWGHNELTLGEHTIAIVAVWVALVSPVTMVIITSAQSHILPSADELRPGIRLHEPLFVVFPDGNFLWCHRSVLVWQQYEVENFHSCVSNHVLDVLRWIVFWNTVDKEVDSRTTSLELLTFFGAHHVDTLLPSVTPISHGDVLICSYRWLSLLLRSLLRWCSRSTSYGLKLAVWHHRLFDHLPIPFCNSRWLGGCNGSICRNLKCRSVGFDMPNVDRDCS